MARGRRSPSPGKHGTPPAAKTLRRGTRPTDSARCLPPSPHPAPGTARGPRARGRGGRARTPGPPPHPAPGVARVLGAGGAEAGGPRPHGPRSYRTAATGGSSPVGTGDSHPGPAAGLRPGTVRAATRLRQVESGLRQSELGCDGPVRQRRHPLARASTTPADLDAAVGVPGGDDELVALDGRVDHLVDVDAEAVRPVRGPGLLDGHTGQLGLAGPP